MLKAYVDLLSQPARALYILLKHTKIPHVIVPVALRKGEHLADEYVKINPFKKVPAIDDGGFKLNECVPIMMYLCNKYKEANHLYPSDLQAKAKVDAFNSWQQLNLRYGGATIFMNSFMKVASGQPVNEKLVDMGLNTLRTSLDQMEDIFLADTPFLYSETMTIADLLGVCELMQPVLGAGMDVFESYPKVAAWFSRVKQTVGEPLFDEAHAFIARGAQLLKAKSIPSPKL